MRVLWFSPTPSLFTTKRWNHNGGGWISSLQKIVQTDSNIDLGVAFDVLHQEKAQVIDRVHYYPIVLDFRLNERLNPSKKLQKLIAQSLQILGDFNPDIIHLFGSESWYGLLVKYTNIPIVIHMQGSLPSYYNARYPPGMSVWNKIFSSKTSIRQKLLTFRVDSTFRKKALQEIEIIKANSYFMGRTHWDKAIVEFYNPTAKYFVCQEALREAFVNPIKKWQYLEKEKIKIISVISGPLYKGVDVVLKTAYMLKGHTKQDFEWNICGTSNVDFFESVYGIEAKKVNVNICGVLSQEDLQKKLIESSFYIHPSYIDNSPNSVCEAQILGLPVIATNVGGVGTLISDHETGFLVPANDPLMIAVLIKRLWKDKDLLQKISESGAKIAKVRHDPVKLKRDLFVIYDQIVERK